MKPEISRRSALTGLSLGGHRSLTILVTALILFLSVAVFFVNTVVISEGNDASYRAQAESDASLTKFNAALLKKVEDFSEQADDTTLPSGRINPFNG